MTGGVGRSGVQHRGRERDVMAWDVDSQGGSIKSMVIVTGAFIAQHAQEQIGGEGTLLIERAGLHRAQIGADGNTEVAALVVVLQRELEDEAAQLIVDLRYPWGGIDRDWRVLDIHAQHYVSEVGLLFFDFILDANTVGRYEFTVSCNGSAVMVPLQLFKDA
jgi:hypothetical protein